ncbi:MAG: helix-turn-helix domain-containing protein [Candidatus Acidiferrum sp.]
MVAAILPFLGPRLLSPEKAAEYIGVSVDIMYEMIRGRKIPYVPKGKNGRQYTIDRCDLDIWIEKNKVGVVAA